ncbi:hypothetical protein FIV42_01620 [Persicimonas caeni]|uniref:Uncharacterized protein n=1 Tax=Persicimonas caeni TaxID=2292766 RepID=A0A4Y6PMG8_PERCE|nr:hypothetical protein [Persicimonas caeni]QDG49481.1 hypothetical protein FIV42_01620 [Persicimonas caeni]QED30702.1 hypothetical protein FRD00_01615 [Persicimonas caeni]
MKSLRIVVLFVVSMVWTLGASACASGDIGPQNAAQTEEDARDDDEQTGRDTWSGASDASDGGVDVSLDTTDTATDTRLDAALLDTGADSGPSGSDSGQQDSGASDADSGSTDPCASVDCADGVCDPSTGQCVGCLSDNDCANGGRCHDREPVCVPACCNSVTQQDSFSSVSYSHNRFDIAVDSTGAPAIAFVDGDTDKIEFAQSINGQWLSQEVGSVSNSLSTNIRMAYAPDDTPHIIVGRYQMLTHFWRDQSGWQSHSLLASPGSVGYVDIVADDQGTIHMVALIDYGAEVLYATHNAQGQRSDEYLTLPAQNPPVWVNLDATSDGRPVASFHIGLDKTVVLAERNAGTWAYETVGQGVSQVHGMAVDAANQPVVAYHKETNDGLRLLRREAQTWRDDLIVADPAHGYSPDVAVDSLGDPHVVYMAQGATQTDNPLYYARWNGAQWEHHQLPGVDRAFYPRIALDATRTPHVAVYDPSRDAIAYLLVQ